MVLAGYTTFIPMGSGSSNTGAIRALRALRALRPLRTIARFESLRSIIVCFLEVRCKLWLASLVPQRHNGVAVWSASDGCGRCCLAHPWDPPPPRRRCPCLRP